MLLLHFTFASGSGRAGHVGHAGCAEFSSIVQSFLFFSSGAGLSSQERERVCVCEDCYVRASGIDRQELRVTIE